MPIGVLVFAAVTIFGLLLMAATRSQWSDELTRLGKHSQRMSEKNHEEGEVSIFLTQRQGYLAKLCSLAGMEAKYDQMRVTWVVTTIVAGAIGFCIPWACGVPDFCIVGAFFGLPIGAGGFVAYMGRVAKKRQDRMTEQLPQVLETMVSSLRAGSPVMEVFKVLSETAPDPLRGEFKRGLISLQLGKSFRDVMNEMSKRIRTPDFRLLTQAIFISQDVGGNLADVVATIADAIRERFKLRDFLNSLTSQGKATAAFIGCLPYGITIMTYISAPSYILPFLNNPICRLICAALVMWELFGFWILMKMTTFEV